jgi:hypothetical protein
MLLLGGCSWGSNGRRCCHPGGDYCGDGGGAAWRPWGSEQGADYDACRCYFAWGWELLLKRSDARFVLASLGNAVGVRRKPLLLLLLLLLV